MTDALKAVFAENKEIFEHTCAEVMQAILEQQNDLVLPEETWKILREAKSAHVERQPEVEY